MASEVSVWNVRSNSQRTMVASFVFDGVLSLSLFLFVSQLMYSVSFKTIPTLAGQFKCQMLQQAT